MKKLFFIISILIGFSSFIEPIETPQEILRLVKNNYDKHSSISYKITYRQKFFDRDDTAQWVANCELIRENNDSIFGGRIWFFTSDSFETYYDLNQIYDIDHSKKDMMIFNAHEDQTGPISSNTAGNVIKSGFLKTGKLLAQSWDTSNNVTMITEENHFVITIQFPSNKDFTEKRLTAWINKKAFTIDKMNYQVKHKGDYQYNEWNISEISFDNVSIDKLDKSIAQYKKSYTTKQYVPPSDEDYLTLPNGSTAPLFSGTNFQTGKSISLNDYKGKTVLLDFSYMACGFCVETIPHMIQLQKDYENKNVIVLAVNSKDNNDKNIKRLPGFIEKHSINYPIILSNRSNDSLYNVKAYPTFYIIDKKGKIVYSNLGFSEQRVDSLKSVIEKQIK
jgi:thiol-disulfide isomerase/thioredoxin